MPSGEEIEKAGKKGGVEFAMMRGLNGSMARGPEQPGSSGHK
jgi:hypothetical protein